MKSKYISPDFEIIKLDFNETILEDSQTDLIEKGEVDLG